MNDFKLTEHFGFFELTRTDKAEYQELNRRKAVCCVPQLKLVCVTALGITTTETADKYKTLLTYIQALRDFPANAEATSDYSDATNWPDLD